jgi:hypothetical protein
VWNSEPIMNLTGFIGFMANLRSFGLFVMMDFEIWHGLNRVFMLEMLSFNFKIHNSKLIIDENG